MIFNILQNLGRHVKEPTDKGEEVVEKNVDHSDAHSKRHALAYQSLKEFSALTEPERICLRQNWTGLLWSHVSL